LESESRCFKFQTGGLWDARKGEDRFHACFLSFGFVLVASQVSLYYLDVFNWEISNLLLSVSCELELEESISSEFMVSNLDILGMVITLPLQK
jgi:hypothetical protein